MVQNTGCVAKGYNMFYITKISIKQSDQPVQNSVNYQNYTKW